jgi:anti-sigma factor RsiW
MKKCEEYELVISSYVDGEIALGEKAALFNHLSSCNLCDRFLYDAIRIRIESARESRIPAPNDAAPAFVQLRSKEVLRYSPDAPATALAAKPRSTRSSVRTLVLAILVVVIGCVMFSTTISLGSRGPGMIQSPQENVIH